MFLPQNTASKAKASAAEQARREGYVRIEGWVTQAIPSEIRRDVTVSVQEVVCGDPACPLDTAIVILFPSGGRGMLNLQLEARHVTKEALLDKFPTNRVLEAWARGEDADWPPFDDDETDSDDDIDEGMQSLLRFEVGRQVVCRVGPDPVTGWAPGRIVQQWYRESTWPVNSWAPYKVELEDGRKLFVPGDVDQVIRAAS